MLIELAHLLPRPGPLWGAYPIRAPDDAAPPRRALRWRSARAHGQSVARHAQAQVARWYRMDLAERDGALAALRTNLRREGLHGTALSQALGASAAVAAQTLGLTPRPGQLLAAALMLDSRMAEMATGEGKTLGLALAAGVAALAGVPVHVVTANEYLARRDAQWLAPFYQAMGLRSGALSGVREDAAKRTIYGHDIVYATAKELAFDFLRDRQTLGARPELERIALNMAGIETPQPVMRGLCMALLDEADSILLDEAEVPLILSRNVPHPARRAFLWQALALARQLQAGRDFTLHHCDRMAALTPVGEENLAALVCGLGGPWQRPRYRREAVVIALAGLHLFHCNQHYLVRDGAIELLDEVTGRVAQGRVWSRGLHTVVALKEGLSPPAETETVAQITFQRFFQRYWRLGGISGTLREAAGELREVYGVGVATVPLHQPCLRRELAPRRFADPDALFAAVAERVQDLSGQGRPVLIGTDSVADSLRVSQGLAARGIEHQVLNALNDDQEADIIARAGRSACVTVATRMAGRGTDIELDAAARSAGGLHVLSCQNNPSRRLDRQLAGRSGRQGDPGSVELWSCEGRPGEPAAPLLDWVGAPPWLALAPGRGLQWRKEQRRAQHRRSLLEQDLHWERRLSFAGTAA